MKTSKKILAVAVAVSLAASTMAPVANAEVSASVGVASSYLWRGFELGSGTPAVSGSLDYSNSGFYAGIWGSSGDATAGNEYDLYVGYGAEVGDFSYGVSIINYIYPTGNYKETEGLGDFMEAIISLGYGPVSFVYHDNIAGDTGGYAFGEDYSYAALSVGFGAFSATLGQHFEDVPVFGEDGEPLSVTGDATHFDLGYAYNDNLSFTLSTIIGSDSGYDEPEPTFVVSYSMPIE
ncbi:TorF family putative porin [Teredinibacter haidensis]|uniref:TorF family putative porin n=1 Tax=Teredinibacter haidensis TaxID=2731755 RepID=UPI0009489D7C|nr:TorF family putative porin [Teredinibacter haidensis]